MRAVKLCTDKILQFLTFPSLICRLRRVTDPESIKTGRLITHKRVDMDQKEQQHESEGAELPTGI